MKTSLELFQKDWSASVEVALIRNRLDYLVKDGIYEGKEVDELLDRLNNLKRVSLKHYNLTEADL